MEFHGILERRGHIAGRTGKHQHITDSHGTPQTGHVSDSHGNHQDIPDSHGTSRVPEHPRD